MAGLGGAGAVMQFLAVDQAMYIGGFPGLPAGKRWA
jgi:hypothetical protein